LELREKMGLAQRYEDVDQCGEDADLEAVGSKNGKNPAMQFKCTMALAK
jgi:hypothetical protein